MPHKTWHFTRTLAGGAGQYALRLSEALRAAGHDSAVLVADGDTQPGSTRLTPSDSRFRTLAARGLRSLFRRNSRAPFHSIRGLETYTSRVGIEPHDVIHLHGMTGWIGTAGLQKLIPRGTRVFWTAHDVWILSGGCVVYQGCNYFQTNCSHCPVLRRPFRGMAARELKHKQSLVNMYNIQPIANSRWMAARLLESKLFGHLPSIPIVPPIVDSAFLSQDCFSLRQQLQIPPDRVVITLGARSLDDRYKGIPEFLQQFATKRELCQSPTILLFGPGRIDIPSNLDVRLLGNVDNARDLARIYQTSDIFISPSRMETFGMTLVEAQASGTPVLALDVGGVRDAVHPDLQRWLEPTTDISKLICRLMDLLTNGILQRSRYSYLRKWARLAFGPAVVGQRQIAVYEASDPAPAQPPEQINYVS